MTGTAEQMLLRDAERELLSLISESKERTPSDEAFVAWALDDVAALAKLAVASATRTKAARTYQDVAVLGYAAAAGVLDDEHVEVLVAGLDWLAGRKAIADGEPLGFCLDSPALLGIALGATAVGAPSTSRTKGWLLTVLQTAHEHARLDDWQKCILHAIDSHLAVGANYDMPDGHDTADVRTFLRAKGLVTMDANADDEATTVSILKTDRTTLPITRAAARVAALDWIRRAAPTIAFNRADAGGVAELLRHVPDGLRRWTWEKKARTRGGARRQWPVDNEYHVQNMLYFLLAPIFPDLKDEEYTASVGQKQPRTDLFLPSLKLIVEVKFLRAGDPMQKIIGEVAEDAGLYLTKGSDYTGIIAFVWDDSRRSEEHGKLIEGLKAISGIVDAIVVSRPGAMDEGNAPA